METNCEYNDVIPTRETPNDPPPAAGEHDSLVSFLDYFRAVLVRKCAGLSREELQRTTAASTLTLGRLLRHMAFVEDYWFQHVLHGRDLPDLWQGADWERQPDWEMDTAADFTPVELADQIDAAVARSRSAVEGLDLAVTAAVNRRDVAVNLRWILIHMIEEYARHCGHADLLRESIDGATGD